MQNIIALIWDFDRTLVDGYMQDPIFRHYNVNSDRFWHEVNELPGKYRREQGVKVNRDTIYLNHFIKYARDGIFADLDNARLKEFGKELKFYNGIPDFLKSSKDMIKDIEGAYEYNLKVEHYIISTGFREEIMGSSVVEYVDGVWGCELIDGEDAQGRRHISEIAYTIDNTTKTRAIFEINKGASRDNDIDVNVKMSDEQRRIDFKNMIYIADGPSDIPAFSLVRSKGGYTFAVYPAGDVQALRQVETLREDGRVDAFAEADYSEGRTAAMLLRLKIEQLAQNIIDSEKRRLKPEGSVPVHLD